MPLGCRRTRFGIPVLALQFAAAWMMVAHAQGAPGVVLTGVATTGSDRRTVQSTLACVPGAGAGVTGSLSIELEVPDSAQLAPVFDFDPFEGPDAHAGPLTRLVVTTTAGTVQGSFTASGYIPAQPSTSFNLAVSATLRRDPALRPVASVLRPLTLGAGTLQWRQANTKRDGAPIIASFDVSAADSARLAAMLAPCLKAAAQ